MVFGWMLVMVAVEVVVGPGDDGGIGGSSSSGADDMLDASCCSCCDARPDGWGQYVWWWKQA